MTTKKKISEQISRIYSRFIEREDTKPNLDNREIMLLVEQAINTILQPTIKAGFKAGKVDVPPSLVYRYTTNAVSTDTVGAYIDLPAHPIDLPYDVGIWAVMAQNQDTDPYIPIPKQFASLMSGTLVAGLEQKVGWRRVGNRVRFTQDITSAAWGSVTNVWVDIVGTDVSQLTDNELLPLNANYENMVIAEVLRILGMGQVAINDELNRDGDSN